VTIDIRLLELDFGDWKADVLMILISMPYSGGRIILSMLHRQTVKVLSIYANVSVFLAGLVHGMHSKSEQILIITHAGVIRALLAYILKLPPANAFQFRVDVGSVHKLQHL